MTLTTTLRTDYLATFETHLYNFPAGSTVNIRQPLIAALEALLDPMMIFPAIILDGPLYDQFRQILRPLSLHLDDPSILVENEEDHQEFKELLKKKIRETILYLQELSDDELRQFIDEKLAEQGRTDQNIKKPVITKLEQDYIEALDDLNRTLLNPTYAQNLKTAGINIRDTVIALYGKKKVQGLTRVLITSNATIIKPSFNNAKACLDEINAIDDEDQRLSGALLLLSGLAIITIYAVILSMSCGAFIPIGIPFFGVFACILIAEMGWIFTITTAAPLIADGIIQLNGDPLINRARHGFFELEKEVKKNQPGEPKLDKPF